MPNEHPPTSPIAIPVFRNQPPDWAIYSDDIHCPLCGYSFRGLSEARCPECGSEFSWRDLLDPRMRDHAYLFEYHSEASLSSFFRTLRAGINSTRFWYSVHPVLPIRVGRLRAYFAWIVLVMFASFLFGQFALARAGGPVLTWTKLATAYHPWTWSIREFSKVIVFNSFFLNFVVWFASTFAAMLVFRVTMRRAKLRTAHVFRCLVYSSDAYVWLAMALFLLDGLALVVSPAAALGFKVLAAIVTALVVWGRLTTAYRIYLQFPHPTATVLATQVIAVLAVLNLHILQIWAR